MRDISEVAPPTTTTTTTTTTTIATEPPPPTSEKPKRDKKRRRNRKRQRTSHRESLNHLDDHEQEINDLEAKKDDHESNSKVFEEVNHISFIINEEKGMYIVLVVRRNAKIL